MTKEQYLELKAELKLLAKVIKYRKHNHRAYQSQSMGGNKKELIEPEDVQKVQISLWKATYEFRHKHIVISLLRGKTREQIECPKPGNEPDERYIKKLLEQYETVDETVRVGS